MKTTTFRDMECIIVQNDNLQLLVTRSIGPRIISLRFKQGENLFAELPDFVTERPDGKIYHFYGGHRLWISPEDPIGSYSLDDQPVEISQTDNGLLIRKPVEPESGIEKSILLNLDTERARVTLTHWLTNRNPAPLECASWAITQLKMGGVAILPQARIETGLLPNRVLSFWPYTDIASPQLTFGNNFILLRADLQKPFKVGFPNPRGWMAYWLDGVLFVKRAAFDPQGIYSDFGSSSECYCNRQFLELETMTPILPIPPNESIVQVEAWELYADVPLPKDEEIARSIANEIGLE